MLFFSVPSSIPVVVVVVIIIIIVIVDGTFFLSLLSYSIRSNCSKSLNLYLAISLTLFLAIVALWMIPQHNRRTRLVSFGRFLFFENELQFVIAMANWNVWTNLAAVFQPLLNLFTWNSTFWWHSHTLPFLCSSFPYRARETSLESCLIIFRYLLRR